MRCKIRLNDKVDIPDRACPVMYMHRPCIISKITPVIFEDAELHEEHWDQHPFVKAFILLGVVHTGRFSQTQNIKHLMKNKLCSKERPNGFVLNALSINFIATYMNYKEFIPG